MNGIAKVRFLAFLLCFLDSQKSKGVCLRIETTLAMRADDCALSNDTSYVKREERACRTKISLVCAGASLHLILQHKLEVRVDQVNQEAALSRAGHQDAGKRTALVLPSALLAEAELLGDFWAASPRHLCREPLCAHLAHPGPGGLDGC